jgi:hypothetical protein
MSNPYDLLNPLALPATIPFTATADGSGIESPPFSHAASASWWDANGPAALAPYSDDALAALRAVADAGGHAALGAALDVINAAAAPQAVRDFVAHYVATNWAEAAEGVTLLAEDATSTASMYEWVQHVAALHAASAQQVQNDPALAVLGQQLAAGGSVFSEIAAVAQLAQTTQSFQLEMTVPGVTVAGADRGDAVLGGGGADTIQTGAGWDVVLGFEGNDSVIAGDGYDLLWGGAGDDILNGGYGVDTAMYSGTMAQYAVAKTSTGYTVSGPEGTDSLVGIERLRFSDGLMALDTEACDGTGPGGHVWQVAALIRAGFGRLPTADELNHWTAECDRAPDMAGLAQQMMNQYAAGMSSQDLIGHLYQQIVREQATVQTVAAYAAQVGPGGAYETMADLVVYAACHPMNTGPFAHLVGVPQCLDPACW